MYIKNLQEAVHRCSWLCKSEWGYLSNPALFRSSVKVNEDQSNSLDNFGAGLFLSPARRTIYFFLLSSLWHFPTVIASSFCRAFFPSTSDHEPFDNTLTSAFYLKSVIHSVSWDTRNLRLQPTCSQIEMSDQKSTGYLYSVLPKPFQQSAFDAVLKEQNLY